MAALKPNTTSFDGISLDRTRLIASIDHSLPAPFYLSPSLLLSLFKASTKAVRSAEVGQAAKHTHEHEQLCHFWSEMPVDKEVPKWTGTPRYKPLTWVCVCLFVCTYWVCANELSVIAKNMHFQASCSEAAQILPTASSTCIPHTPSTSSAYQQC